MDRLEQRARLIAQDVPELGRGLDQCLHSWILVVENAQRVGVQAPLGILIEQLALCLEVGDELCAEGVPLGARADGVELERDGVEAEPPPEAANHDQLLDIDIRAGKAERLCAESVVLPITSFLWALVAKQWPAIPESFWTIVEQVVLERGAHGWRCALGAQRQVLAVIVEGVHLFLDDVGDLPDTAHE